MYSDIVLVPQFMFVIIWLKLTTVLAKCSEITISRLVPSIILSAHSIALRSWRLSMLFYYFHSKPASQY